MTYSLETKKEIWNDKYGTHFEIGPDRDALGLIEIRSYEEDGKLVSTMTLQKEEATLLAIAINELSSICGMAQNEERKTE